MRISIILCRSCLFFLSLSFAFFMASPIRALDSYANHNHKVIAGSEPGYPPFSLVSQDGSVDGFSVELLREVAGVMHLDLEFVAAPWHELKQELAEGRLDVLPVVAFTDERDKVYDFTIPYFNTHGEVFVRKGENSIHNFDDLRNKKIITMRDDIAHEYLLSKNLGKNLVLTNSFEEALKKLSAGQYDAVVAQELMGQQLIRDLGLTNIEVVNGPGRADFKNQPGNMLPGFEQKWCFAVRDGNADLLAHLNEGLAIVFTNGTFDRLQEKWLVPVSPEQFYPLELLVRNLIYIILPILVILALLAIWFTRREIAVKTRKLCEKIEEKNKFESELIRSHREWSAAMDASEDAIYILDNDRKIVTANKTFYKMTGSNPETAIGTHIEKIVHPQGEEEPCPVCRAQEEKRDEIIVMEPDHPDNPVSVPLEVTVKVIRDDDGNPVSTFMRLHDLSRRRETENILRKSRDEWEKTFDAMSDIVTIQDREMRIIRANRAAHEFFGEEKGALHGRYCYEVFRGTTQPCPQCPELLTGHNDKDKYATVKHEALDKTFYVARSPVWGEDGQIEHIIHVAKDISKQKKLEEELFQARKMEAIGTLAGGIAHDFNNILASIIGYSELSLLELEGPNPVREYIDQINVAGNRAKDLVKQILSFSRKVKAEREPFMPASIVKEALKLMRASLPSSIVIREEIDPDSGKILADPTSLHQIIVNLFTNALHAMEDEKGEIRVRLAKADFTEGKPETGLSLKPGRYVLLSISDTGVGMDERTVERIFEPYFTTKEVGKGTGMGLSLVHNIMQRYEGIIKVESEPGGGSTFYLYFPTYEGEREGDVEVADYSFGSLPKGGERVMVVDDEETVLRLQKTVLEGLGYKVAIFNSSHDALAEFERRPEDFDLLITDQTMPELTGIELCAKIRQASSDIPMILCTGFSSTVNEKTAKKIGISRYIYKPIKLRELASDIREILDGRN